MAEAMLIIISQPSNSANQTNKKLHNQSHRKVTTLRSFVMPFFIHHYYTLYFALCEISYKLKKGYAFFTYPPVSFFILLCFHTLYQLPLKH